MKMFMIRDIVLAQRFTGNQLFTLISVCNAIPNISNIGISIPLSQIFIFSQLFQRHNYIFYSSEILKP